MPLALLHGGETRFARDGLGGSLKLAPLQYLKKIAHQDDAPSPLLRKSMFHEKQFALRRSEAYCSAEAMGRQPSITFDKLSIEPCRGHHTRLLFDRYWTMQAKVNATKLLPIVGLRTRYKIRCYPPSALFDPLHDTSAAQRFQTTDVRRDDALRAIDLGGAQLCQVLLGTIDQSMGALRRDC